MILDHKKLIEIVRAICIAAESPVPEVSGVDAALIPGEPERIARSDRTASGLSIDEVTWEGILETGEAVNFNREEAYKIIQGGR